MADRPPSLRALPRIVESSDSPGRFVCVPALVVAGLAGAGLLTAGLAGFAGVGFAGAGFAGAGLGGAGLGRAGFAGAGFGGTGLGIGFGTGFGAGVGFGAGLGCGAGTGTGSGNGAGSGGATGSATAGSGAPSAGAGASAGVRSGAELCAALSSISVTSTGGLSILGRSFGASKPSASRPNRAKCPTTAMPRPVVSVRSICLFRRPADADQRDLVQPCAIEFPHHAHDLTIIKRRIRAQIHLWCLRPRSA